MKAFQVRQGDVLVTGLAKKSIPSEAALKSGRVILALGEATGHHHEVEVMEPGTVELYEHEGMVYLRILKESPLTHQTHGPHPLLIGEYEVELQREFYDGLVRQVID